MRPGNATNGTRLSAPSGTTRIMRVPMRCGATGSHIMARKRCPATCSDESPGQSAARGRVAPAAIADRHLSIRPSMS